MGALRQDLRYATRSLSRNPGFTLVALATLALAIGSVTSIFSVLDAALLRPLPYRDPAALVTVSLTRQEPGRPAEPYPWSYPKFESLRRHSRTLSPIAGYCDVNLNLTGTPEPERLKAEIVSAAYFSTLGVGAALGRTFQPEEDLEPGDRPAALIGWGLWHRRFGGEPSVLGRSIELQRTPITIVGVLPRGFSGLTGSAEIWVPTSTTRAMLYPDVLHEAGNHWLQVVARRRPGVDAAAAAAEMPVVGSQVDREYPDDVAKAAWSATLSPLDASRADPRLRRSVLVLFGAVTFVLLIACANVAALLLARSAGRGREVAIRIAVGAGHRRILRLLLTESVLLALLGGVAGTLLSLWGVDALSRLDSSSFSGIEDSGFLFRFESVSLDPRVLLFALGLSALTGLLFGLVPALRASRRDPIEALKEGAVTAGSRGLGRPLSARALLVPAQVALALVLLVGAGLTGKSLLRLEHLDAGIRPERLLTMHIQPNANGEEEVRRAVTFRRQLLERVRSLPGVVRVSFGPSTPLSGRGMIAVVRQVDDRTFTSGGGAPDIGVHDVGPGYFATLGARILRGREFTDADREGSPKVAVINQAAARRFWPGQDPIGRRIAATTSFFPKGETAEIVGVAADIRYGRPDDPLRLDLYFPSLQGGLPRTTLFLRTAGDPGALSESVRREVHALDPNLPVFDVRTMEERAARAYSPERFAATLLGLLAGIALVLASVGLYGLMAEIVARQRREIGVRMALGARPFDIQRRFLARGLALAGIGLAAGLAGAVALSRLLARLLFEVEPVDLATYVSVSALLFTVAAAASWLPARRAMRVDPIATLRSE